MWLFRLFPKLCFCLSGLLQRLSREKQEQISSLSSVLPKVLWNHVLHGQQEFPGGRDINSISWAKWPANFVLVFPTYTNTNKVRPSSALTIRKQRGICDQKFRTITTVMSSIMMSQYPQSADTIFISCQKKLQCLITSSQHKLSWLYQFHIPLLSGTISLKTLKFNTIHKVPVSALVSFSW